MAAINTKDEMSDNSKKSLKESLFVNHGASKICKWPNFWFQNAIKQLHFNMLYLRPWLKVYRQQKTLKSDQFPAPKSHWTTTKKLINNICPRHWSLPLNNSRRTGTQERVIQNDALGLRISFEYGYGKKINNTRLSHNSKTKAEGPGMRVWKSF